MSEAIYFDLIKQSFGSIYDEKAVHVFNANAAMARKLYCNLGYVYTTTIPPVSAIIPVKYVAVTPRVYTVTVKTIPVSANICISLAS